MLRVKVFNDMGRTGLNLFYEMDKIKPLDSTRKEFSFEGKILDGPFKGDRQVVTLSGKFDPKKGTGQVDAWESRVDGDSHYRMDFDDPIRLQALRKDLEAAPDDGIRFVGNRHANEFHGDKGKDRLSGGGGEDSLGGLDGNDALDGGGGKDLLSGGDGKDRLSGGAANDGLVGGKGNDKLSGGGGRDLLIGSAGQDRLAGGGGSDRFRYEKESDSGTGRKAHDIITDFVSGTDLIDLSPMDARTKTGRDDKFTYIGDQKFSDRAGELRLHDSTLSGDTDGNGRADFEIFLAHDIDVLKDALIL